MTGLAVLLGNERSKHETYMQASGKGRRLKSSILRKAIDQRATLHRSLLRYVNYFLDQAAMTARQRPQHDRGAPRALAAYG